MHTISCYIILHYSIFILNAFLYHIITNYNIYAPPYLYAHYGIPIWPMQELACMLHARNYTKNHQSKLFAEYILGKLV